MKKKETQSTDFNLISPIAQLVSEGLTWLTKLLIDSLSGSIKALMEMMKKILIPKVSILYIMKPFIFITNSQPVVSMMLI